MPCEGNSSSRVKQKRYLPPCMTTYLLQNIVSSAITCQQYQQRMGTVLCFWGRGSFDQGISLWGDLSQIIWNAYSQVCVLQGVLPPKLSLNTPILQFFSCLLPLAPSFPYCLNPLPSLGTRILLPRKRRNKCRILSGRQDRWGTSLLKQLRRKIPPFLLERIWSWDT